jgi:hypothetical protein
VDAFWAKVDRSADADACWPWRTAVNNKGYGAFRGRTAHRFAYALAHPDADMRGLDVHHTCCNKACMNPAHLQLLSHRDHLQVHETAIAAKNARKTHCKRGHEFTPVNTRLRDDGHIRRRQCRQCESVWRRTSALRRASIALVRAEQQRAAA